MSFAPLTRPATAQVKVDQTQNLPQSDGFSWPTFRLLNKQARVTLSPDFLVPSNVRKVLTIASVHGLFAATTSKGLIISPLSELREAFKSGTDSVFTPKRTLPCNPVCISFACNDTRLLAGTETGQILVFDTAQLNSSSAQVDPIHVFQGSSSPVSQILPNPSNENDFAQLVAILRVDGTVQMLDMQMESKGAWAGTDFESTLVAASWSPKGKQLAVGLRSGDIFTLGLTNNNSPLKHIPPTSNSPLVSLQWVGPALTFRTSYGANPVDPPHHIVSLDTRSNTAAFSSSYPDGIRMQLQRLPKKLKALIVVGDTSSTDLEVLGNTGSRWFQQSQENPLTVPLDKNDEDTFLLTLDVDLTDELPIMYAYLNDGTVQGWYITHSDSKPYVGRVGAAQASPSAPAFGQQAGSSAFGQQQPSTPSTSPFLQATPPTTAFGQSSGFGQSTTSAFGQTQSQTTFGQAQTTSAFGQTGFGQPAFGQSSFGAQAPSAFGSSNNTSSGFGAFAGTPNAFSSLAGGSSNAPPAAPPPLSSTPSVSMGDAAPSFGGLSLGGSSSESDTKNKAVGGGMFGSGPPPLPLPPNHPANQPSTPSPSNFSDPALIKPASGFGAFGALSSGAFGSPKPSSSFGSGGGAFGGGAFGGSSGSNASDTKPASTASPAFGSTGFGFGQSSFGQKPASVFGQSSFGSSGAASTATPSTGGGFSAFASTGPTGFGNAASSSAFGGGGSAAGSSSGATTSTGGFSGFASQGPSAFGKPSAFGGNAGAPPSASAIASAFSGFGTPKDSLFGNKTPAAQVDSASSSPEPAKDLKSPSPGDSPPPSSPSPLKFTASNPTTTGGAFGNLKSASTGFLKPASGFGAFGSDTTPTSSPFFNAASQTPKTPPVSAFGNLGSTPPTTPKPATGGSPAFGATSQLGGFKSSFTPASPASTPVKTPTTASGGFSAFSAPVSLSSSTTPAKSFGDLLKTGDDSQEKPKPVSAFGGSGFGSQPKQESSSPSPSPASTAPVKPAPVFTPPPKDMKDKAPESSSPKDDGKATSEFSFGELSQSSSFVEISGGDVEGDAGGEPAEDGEPEDDGEPGDDDDGESFLSESFGSGSEAPPDEDDGEDDSRSPSPSAVPLPPSRSPSSTPRAELPPKINVESTPEEDDEDEGESDSSEGRLSTIREESTTPPGSPEKNPSPPTKTPLAAPVPVPFGLGLGRPNTRPTRSSPLANAPVSSDEDERTPKDEKPAVLKPRPASPKPLFGSFTPPVKTESIAENDGPAAKPARPKTPPLSALSFGFGSSAPKAPLNAGKIPLAGAPLPTLPTSTASPITPGSASPTSAGGFFGFGTPKTTASPTISTPTPVPAPKGFPGIQSAAAFPKPISTPVAPPPEATMEEGMQKECALLFANMTRGLEDFRLLAQAANQRRLELSKSAGGSRRASDLGNRTKWSLADAAQFGQTLRQYEQDLADLKEQRSRWEKSIRELQSNLLKAGTRREEIGRFLKAQHDNDFAKMLKARTLGPEHLETQTHLRRSIRAMQDRIQKLESHLQESKKRLSRANSGNPGLRAPTLDTLNRTFRNMDIALDNQTSDVQRLTARVAKLNMKDSQRNGHAASTRDARLPDPVTRQRPINVTPHVAVTTAAALNAERSAHKLKRALLSVRKEPLLNTQAASAPPAPLAFNTPQKPGLGLGLGLAGGIPSTPPQSMPGFDFPEDTFNPSPPPAVRRGAGGGGKSRISQSVPLKRSPAGYSTPSPPPTFDWGPLPTFQKPTPVSPGNSLSGSWVADGFGSKK
ncbi:hypothetical protein MSAN_00400600 [Mycena sanguinolenta]|uniref:Nucleoporin Nup159/Nup146 N-terminal domain-containing protein n=1 Tax=Mycena sanguinolenta TaxID=230812 RepID=A0A8H6ZD03_9AGAR|nr:hypothetical protein MSAN_00400600 [Mycena sanguinolenta]